MQRQGKRRKAAPRSLPAHPRSARHDRSLMPLPDVLSRSWRASRLRPSRLPGARISLVFWTWAKFLKAQPYRALAGLASGLNEGRGSVAIGTAAAIVRANLTRTGPAPALAGSFPSLPEDCPNADYSCVCPGCGRWRCQQHVDVSAAVRADLRDHVFPDSAPAAEEGEGSCRAREEYPPR